MIAKFGHGHDLLEFLPMPAPIVPHADSHIPITWSKVYARHDGKWLWIHNHNRQQWEIPGGGRWPNETPDDCARREAMEESCQRVENLVFKGLFKIRLSYDGRLEFGALYIAEVREVLPFKVNNEADAIVFANVDELEGKVSDLSIVLMPYC